MKTRPYAPTRLVYFPPPVQGADRPFLSLSAALRSIFVFAAFLLLTGVNAHAQGSVATDRTALVALYNATDGSNWTDSTNWLTTEALSAWYGVITDGTGRVRALSLSQNMLSGTIPAELGSLTSLLELSLHDNQS